MNLALFTFWLGGLIATVLNMAIEWTRMGPEHQFFYVLRAYPVRVFVSSVIMVIVWPILLTAVLAKQANEENVDGR